MGRRNFSITLCYEKIIGNLGFSYKSLMHALITVYFIGMRIIIGPNAVYARNPDDYDRSATGQQ